MKILINAPIMGDKIIDLLENYKEGGVEFTLIKKSGMKIEFEVSGLTGQAAASLAKNLIKSTEFGKVLYFNVEEIG